MLMKACSVVSRERNGTFLPTSLTKSFLVITTQSSAGTSTSRIFNHALTWVLKPLTTSQEVLPSAILTASSASRMARARGP